MLFDSDDCQANGNKIHHCERETGGVFTAAEAFNAKTSVLAEFSQNTWK